MPSKKMDMNRIKDKSLSELIDRYLSDEGIEVFDNVVDAAKRKASRVRTLSWSTAGLVAASIAIFVLTKAPMSDNGQTITTIQIAEAIQSIIELDLGDVETINATPMGDKAMLTATLRDGSTYTYIMSCNIDDGSTSILAYNQ